MEALQKESAELELIEKQLDEFNNELEKQKSELKNDQNYKKYAYVTQADLT